ncbi:MAG: T9SS type A sorting domain-containing protein [Bacteroidales bacterium]|nr:T9SS type A sorting domain-containing protein [Bacteroidales bacterium]
MINGSALNLNIAATAGMYNTSINKAFSVGLQIETWESNTFTQFQWENSSPIPWTIVSSGAYEGQYCAKSGRISHSSQTHLSITLNVLNNDSISFYKKVSCETPGNNWTGSGLSYYDYFSFSIDNQLLGQWAGEIDWQLVTYPVSEGEHTFVWSYVKDYSDNGGSDCAWIDNITLPAYALDSAIININTPIVVEELNIYPNPANETAFLNINLAESCNVSILVFNSNGQVVKEISEDLMSGENYIQINTSPLQNGFYIVKTIFNNKVISKNLTIMR